MIWTNPIAALGILALAAPILIHILARQKAPRLPFPTLRFIQPFQLAAIRRRALEDAALLAVRALIVATAVAAVAGPFLVTASRRRAWDARTIRADVTGDLADGLPRAIAWLDAQPPGRREIVVRAPLTIGSISQADIEGIPARIGLRFERTGDRPDTRTVETTSVIAGGRLVAREVTLDRARTSVRDRQPGSEVPLPVELRVPADQRRASEALIRALEAARIPAPDRDRSALVVFGDSEPSAPLRTPWMADAAARIVREAPVSGIRFAADGKRVLVRVPGSVSDPSALPIVRAVVESLAPPAARLSEEVVPISDAQLRTWTREPGPAEPPKAGTIDRDDRRWLWAIALVLIAAETWLRRSKTSQTAEEVRARVA